MAFRVSGSGEAKISASMIALSSAEPRRGSCWSSERSCPSCSASAGADPSAGFGAPCVASPPCLSSPSTFLTFVLRVANRMRGIGRAGALVNTNGSEAARLKHAHQLQPDHFEQGEKSHDEPGTLVDIGKELFKP